MSRTGDCHDNAVAESFFASLKTEWVDHQDYPNRDAASASLGEYIDASRETPGAHTLMESILIEESNRMREGSELLPDAPPTPADPPVVRKRGFAAMTPELVRAIARKGEVAAHAAGTAHEFTSEEARVAGRKGARRGRPSALNGHRRTRDVMSHGSDVARDDASGRAAPRASADLVSAERNGPESGVLGRNRFERTCGRRPVDRDARSRTRPPD